MFDKKAVEYFYKNQLQLFPEKVAETQEEAAEFLEDVCAVLCSSRKEAVEYMKDAWDTEGMTEDELLNSDEVFKLPDGRFLIVEG